MTAWLHMIGITDISHIEVEKTPMGPEVDYASRVQACARATALAATL